MKHKKTVYFYIKNYPYSDGRRDILDLYKNIFEKIGFKVSFTKKILNKKIYVFFDENYQNKYFNIFKKINKNNFTILVLTEYFSQNNYDSYNLFYNLGFIKKMLLFLFSKKIFLLIYKFLINYLKFLIVLALTFFLFSSNYYLLLLSVFLFFLYFFNKYYYPDLKEKIYFKQRYQSIVYLILNSNLILSNLLVKNTMKKNRRELFDSVKSKFIDLILISHFKIKKKYKADSFDFMGDFNLYRKNILHHFLNNKKNFSNKQKNKILKKIKLTIDKRPKIDSKYLIYLSKDKFNPYVSDTAINLSIKNNSIPLIYEDFQIYKKGIYKNFFIFKNHQDLHNYQLNYDKFFKKFLINLKKIENLNKNKNINLKKRLLKLLKKYK